MLRIEPRRDRTAVVVGRTASPRRSVGPSTYWRATDTIRSWPELTATTPRTATQASDR